MVPVDHVAAATGAAAVSAAGVPTMTVLHMTASPTPSFNNILSCLSRYGYATEPCEYVIWRRKLEQHVIEVQDNALFPLLHFVLDDLPTSTKAPELNDSNMVKLLNDNGLATRATVNDDLMGKYVAWLVGVGFLPAPTGTSPEKELPSLDGLTVKAVGRSGN
jgi:L-aminoadipate-semialdehyde dehydrogenase